MIVDARAYPFWASSASLKSLKTASIARRALLAETLYCLFGRSPAREYFSASYYGIVDEAPECLGDTGVDAGADDEALRVRR